MFAAVDWANLGIVIGGFSTAAAIVGAPAAYFFHKKVVRPLKWVLGVPAEDSPDGKAIPPIPHQLADLRIDVMAVKTEMHPNGGSSMRDSLNRNEMMTAQSQKLLQNLDIRLSEHVVDDAKVQKSIDAQLKDVVKQQAKDRKRVKAAASSASQEVEDTALKAAKELILLAASTKKGLSK